MVPRIIHFETRGSEFIYRLHFQILRVFHMYSGKPQYDSWTISSSTIRQANLASPKYIVVPRTHVPYSDMTCSTSWVLLLWVEFCINYSLSIYMNNSDWFHSIWTNVESHIKSQHTLLSLMRKNTSGKISEQSTPKFGLLAPSMWGHPGKNKKKI